MVCFPGETIALVQTDSDAEQYIERDPARTMVNSEMTTSVDGGRKEGGAESAEMCFGGV